MSRINLSVNGHTYRVDVDTDTPLLYILRNDLNRHGPKFSVRRGSVRRLRRNR
jgi:nicotinate dehydrogenase subunit A